MCVEVTENRVLFTASAFKTHNVVNIAPNTVICITLRSQFQTSNRTLFHNAVFKEKKIVMRCSGPNYVAGSKGHWFGIRTAIMHAVITPYVRIINQQCRETTSYDSRVETATVIVGND